MNRLTPEERRKVSVAQQRARATMLARLNTPLAVASGSGVDERGRQLLFTAMVVGAMLAGSVLASQAVEFHLPASLIEALLPRL
jgi:hypothetical protein